MFSCTIQDGLTHEEHKGYFGSWKTVGYRRKGITGARVPAKSYEYGEIVIPRKSTLANNYLEKDIQRLPFIVKSVLGDKVGWICSVRYLYKRTPTIKLHVRFLEPLKYCEHVENMREKYT